jgi:hypothetical protein
VTKTTPIKELNAIEVTKFPKRAVNISSTPAATVNHVESGSTLSKYAHIVAPPILNKRTSKSDNSAKIAISEPPTPVIQKPVKSLDVMNVTYETPAPVPNTTHPSNLIAYHPGQPNVNSKHPETWTASQVAGWLKSKNATDNIVQVVLNECITGLSLLYLTPEDMAAIGIRLYGERMHLGILIRDLKKEWRVSDGSSTGGAASGVGFGNGVGIANVVPGSVAARMESGKGAPATDAPPSYSQVL